ncbi:hypothetical protein JCM9279_001005 [Rhodotorula babjevae]
MAQPRRRRAAAPVTGVDDTKLSAVVEADFNVHVTVDLDLKLHDPDLYEELGLNKMPLCGRWYVCVELEEQDIRFQISHAAADDCLHGMTTCVEMELSWEDGGRFRSMHKVVSFAGLAPQAQPQSKKLGDGFFLDLTPQHIAAAQQDSNGSYDPAQQRKYRLTFDMRQDRCRPPRGARALAVRAPDSAAKAQPHDVRLFFPGTDERADAELWTTERFLTTSSTYFRNLFSSGLAETVTIGVKRARTGRSQDSLGGQRLSVKPHDSKHSDEDSDRETDAFMYQGMLSQPSPASHDSLEGDEFSYKQVTVEQAAYTTYRAVLLWLSTGFIDFVPLTSSFAATADPLEARMASLLALHKVDACLPIAASPKSVYRLAHILELDELEAIAMRFVYDECLTVDTAPIELFSELARDHAPWRAGILDWILAHWDEVKVSEAWIEMKRRVACDELEGAGPVFLELTERRMGG